MDDIVDLLKRWPGTVENACDWERAQRLMKSAADEIEKLRKLRSASSAVNLELHEEDK